jgi:tripartite-type tricarboxylate transporter receptor subunit TctC
MGRITVASDFHIDNEGGMRMKVSIVKMALCAIAICSLGTAKAVAQQTVDYPTRVVRIVVPYPAGGGPDTFTRLVAEKLAEKWKQPVIIENRAGGGGNVGAAHVARADPDGYTLLSSPPGPIAINGSLFKKLSYDPAKWSPITILTRQPMVLGARKNLPVDSLQQLIALAKQNPGKFTYGSLGFGSISQLTMIRLLSMAGVKLLHVPYNGSTPALVGLMGDQVDIVFDNPVTYVPPFLDGRIRILAAGDAKRLPMLPNTPTFSEVGFSGLRPYAWLAVVAPPKTPAAITQLISKAMAEALTLPDVKSKMEAFVTEPVGGTPADTAEFLAQERAKWRAVIQSANLSVN